MAAPPRAPPRRMGSEPAHEPPARRRPARRRRTGRRRTHPLPDRRPRALAAVRRPRQGRDDPRRLPRKVGTMTAPTPTPNDTTANASVILVGVAIVSVLAATVALAWHGTLNGEACSGIIFAILAGVLGAG